MRKQLPGRARGAAAIRTSRFTRVALLASQRILMVAVPSSSDTTSDMEDSFAALFEESLKRDEVKEGEIVKGKVIAIGKENVVVDRSEEHTSELQSPCN